MRRLKQDYPEFADSVDLYAIGQDLTEGIGRLEDHRAKEELPFPVAVVDNNALRSLEIIRQSTKVAVDHNGVITYRAGLGEGEGDWPKVFADLASGAGG